MFSVLCIAAVEDVSVTCHIVVPLSSQLQGDDLHCDTTERNISMVMLGILVW